MREIKFRAWDESGKVMVYFDFHHLVRAGGRGEMDDGCRPQDLLDPLVPKMQFINMKDKNGKEIYEGDIVRAVAEQRYAEHSGVLRVIFSFCFELAWALAEDGASHGLSPAWGGWESLEVIGNIYENPTLLK